MNQAQTGADAKRRKNVRRHRRERQIAVFGVMLIALAALFFAAFAVYQGRAEGPFSAAFNTPAAELEEIDLVCPASGSLPLDPGQVVVRVNNATDTSGLAGSVSSTLDGRGFVTVGTANWNRDYEDYVQIRFGADGVQQAYTLARQFNEAELVLDSREGITVDLILGDEFAEAPQLREPLAPELDPDVVLTADGECRSASLVDAEPAPRILPENPLAEASPTPSPEPES
ncbi:LytR C-terminal domain-containing protein [Demequina sp.]|uniref:LytR C-terminal domain-containing protein n=1 Tax=Demequina sp. TaxID=2050685 RepID=UPI003A88334F